MHLPGGAELIIILAVLLLLFGASKLPQLARSMGQASKEFKSGLKEGAQDEAARDEPAGCQSCGQQLLAEAKFCPACGAEAHAAA